MWFIQYELYRYWRDANDTEHSDCEFFHVQTEFPPSLWIERALNNLNISSKRTYRIKIIFAVKES